MATGFPKSTIVASTMLALATVPLGAQRIQGTVRESVNQQPVAGVVLTLLDSGGGALGRNITNERGHYAIALPAAARQLQLRRIGYRPTTVDIPRTKLADGDVVDLNVVMVAIPTLLEPIKVTTTGRCPARKDRDAAFALLQQAQAGLLATVVAREANPAKMTRLRYERRMEGTSDHVADQGVRIDSADKVTTSFQAVSNAATLVDRGFVRDSAGTGIYYGPDADVLLDDAFVNTYCFHLESGGRDRANQVGLAFAHPQGKRGRVDIEGTLWVDTLARALRDVQFHYVGLAEAARLGDPGGAVEFREMANGVVFIDRWSLRMTGLWRDTVSRRSSAVQVQMRPGVRETGGEVANASWPDGATWTDPLGRVRITMVDDAGKPVTDVSVRLTGTDYVGRPDASGTIEFSKVLPGPYRVTVSGGRLASLGLDVPTDLRIVAVRESTVAATIRASGAAQLVHEACRNNRAWRDVVDTAAWIIGRVRTPNKEPVADAHWTVSRNDGMAWKPVIDDKRTDDNGEFASCAHLNIGDDIQISVWRDGEPPVVAGGKIGEHITIVPIQLPSRDP